MEKAFEQLVLEQLKDVSEKLDHVEERLQKLELRWATLAGAASVIGAAVGYFGEKMVSWIS